MKKLLSTAALSILTALALTACGGDTGTQTETDASSASVSSEGETAEAEVEEELVETDDIIRVGQSVGNTNLDPHKEYFGWNDCTYGLNEALFKVSDDYTVEPWIAESAEMDGNTWTIKLKDGVCFSNGNPLTSQIVIDNLKRAAEVNNRFVAFKDWEFAVVDDSTFTITTPSVYVTLPNDLSDPSLSMVDLENTESFETNPICTGPFKVETFDPGSGDITLSRNENYWDGVVVLAGADIKWITDDESRLMAMQNGEIDCYPNVTSSAAEIFAIYPDMYDLVTVPSARIQYYMIHSRVPESVREAINLIVDKEEIAAYLSGATIPAVGPFSTEVPYGKAEVPETNVKKAKEVLEADGYTIGADGFYQKDGQPLTINLSTNTMGGRFLDDVAIIMNQQLAAAGINSSIYQVENADQYISSGDFDIGFYSMVADKAGDPYYFLDAILRDDVYLDCMGYDNQEIQDLLQELLYEEDADKRAELANEIVQITIDENMFGWVGIFNKTTVLSKGVKGFAETSPFDYYGLTASSRLPQ